MSELNPDAVPCAVCSVYVSKDADAKVVNGYIHVECSERNYAGRILEAPTVQAAAAIYAEALAAYERGEFGGLIMGKAREAWRQRAESQKCRLCGKERGIGWSTSYGELAPDEDYCGVCALALARGEAGL